MDRTAKQTRMEGNGIDPPADEDEVTAQQQPKPSASGRPLREPLVLTTHQFMTAYAQGYTELTSTANGWSPLHRDYINMSFFLASANAAPTQQTLTTTAAITTATTTAAQQSQPQPATDAAGKP
jgi:hypothetical protein